jgi:hypothetical protein
MSTTPSVPIRVLDPAPIIQSLRRVADLLESWVYTWAEGGIVFTHLTPERTPDSVTICSDLKMTRRV